MINESTRHRSAELMLLVALAAPTATAELCDNATAGAKQLLWGDLHTHTAWSLDAYAFGAVATPADAYAFAGGQPLRLDNGELTQIDRPLDFAAVTDHADAFDVMYLCTDPLYADRADCRTIREARHARRSREIFTEYLLPIVMHGREPELCAEHGSDCAAARRGQWRRVQAAANEADRPCRFTAFIGYEWSATPGGRHWHRNVIFRSAQVPDQAFDFVRYPQVQALWTALDRACRPEQGCDVLAIPHNLNLADGGGFEVAAESDSVLALRARYERLAEIHQEKGASECLPVDPEDGSPACDAFERLPIDFGTRADAAADPRSPEQRWQQARSGFYRSLLSRGLIAYDASPRSLNPLMLGAIGSTDNHLGTPGRVQEQGFFGGIGSLWQDDTTRLSSPGYNPGGLVAVWATQNTRADVFDALQRREAYATSGPRISLRFGVVPAGPTPTSACTDGPLELAVPMGGTLTSGRNTPQLLIMAGRDRVPLARLEIVKAHLSDGAVEEIVHTVAEFADGTDSACRVWEDPGFDRAAPAYWYARVLQQPTPRWSRLLCERVGRCDEFPQADVMVQERAWSSPIWYEPGEAH